MKETSKELREILGIFPKNPRITVTRPMCPPCHIILGVSSGIHPDHGIKYIRKTKK